jgi:alkylation response protein AidB-like acyl-CoA dehydrogenase
VESIKNQNNHISNIVDHIEKFLGERSLLITKIIQDDNKDEFPNEALKWIDQGILNYVALKEHGGHFTNLHDLFWLSRLVSRRNLTSAIALGQTFLGTLPVYIAGDDYLKKLACQKLLEGGLSCLALTEETHGSDITSTETYYKDESLTGKKWCINNATIGKSQSIIVQSNKGLCFLYIDKASLPKASYSNIDKIKTHGIKGADISGITYNKAPVNEKYVIGRQGKGIDILQKTMQVSRTFCTTFSIGSLESCLKESHKFAINRILYNKPVIEMDNINNDLKKSYLTLLAAEAIGLTMTRFVTEHPEVMSLYSAVAKYQVPMMTTNSIESLCEVVGAKAYLRENTYAILEKYRRDHKVVSIFDGSSAVNLSIIARQFNNIKRHLSKEKSSEHLDKFIINKKWESFTGDGLILSNRSHDIVFCTYYNIKNLLNDETQKTIDSQLEFLLSSIESYNGEMASTKAHQIAKNYCQCLSACLYVSFFAQNEANFKQNIKQNTVLPQVINQIFEQDIDFNAISLDIDDKKLISHWDLDSLE